MWIQSQCSYSNDLNKIYEYDPHWRRGGWTHNYPMNLYEAVMQEGQWYWKFLCVCFKE